ncbi:MAG TPA: choice-of-anchor tandem repeat GloVer-containing protein [Rhizomicrobium sp.]
MKITGIGLFAATIACALAQSVPAANAAQLQEKILWSFAKPKRSDAQHPEAPLIDVNGILYGSSYFGGAHKRGAIFSLNLETGAETVLYSFCSQHNCADGSYPLTSLIDVNGILYGTTVWGGSSCAGHGCGAVFSLDPNSGVETVVHAFGSGTDGVYPEGGMIDVRGTLYGTTEGGGTGCQSNGGCGTVFALDPNTGNETVVYSFQGGADGSLPTASLTNVKGTLYGTTDEGGANCQSTGGCGTVFALDPKTGGEKILYSFCGQQNCTDGISPQFLVDVKGMLYGTTLGGGAQYGTGCFENLGCGTVFALDPDTGAEKVLYAFAGGDDGANPELSGVISMKGMLYGTTTYGGGTGCLGAGCGIVFAIDPGTGAETLVHSFCGQSKKCTDGTTPEAGLINMNGTLYGTTFSGGAYSAGTIFALTK